MNNKKNKGFTLVELVICVLIVGILISASVVGVFKWVHIARESADRENLTNLAKNIAASIEDTPNLESMLMEDNLGSGYTNGMWYGSVLTIDLRTYNYDKILDGINGKQLSWEFLMSDGFVGKFEVPCGQFLSIASNGLGYKDVSDFIIGSRAEGAPIGGIYDNENNHYYVETLAEHCMEYMEDVSTMSSSEKSARKSELVNYFFNNKSDWRSRYILGAWLGYNLDRLGIEKFKLSSVGKYDGACLHFYKTSTEDSSEIHCIATNHHIGGGAIVDLMRNGDLSDTEDELKERLGTDKRYFLFKLF